ncbi:MAG: right-handed parallel beta-helix repeat-containing protein [Chthoniobacteraceae bacterium]
MKYLLLLLASVAAAAEIRVTPDAPLAAAIARAASGDTLVLAPGIYRETVRVEKTLTLRGEPGAVLDGSEPLKAAWTESDGVFTATVKKRPRGLLVDGKFIAEIRFDRAQEQGDWHWRTLLRQGPPLSKFDGIRALWTYDPGEQRIHARFENGARPDGLALSIVPARDALIHIANARGVIVEGLTFSGGANAIVLGEGAVECIVRHCRVTSFESTGIDLTGGASRCLVEDCDITRGSLEDWTPSLKHDRANYEIWRIHKDVGNYDRNGIDLVRAGAGNRILRNRVHLTFDGIALGDSSAESLDKPLPDPDHGRGTEIAENVIENTRDSGIELGTGCIDVNVHHNTLRRTHGGLRFKLPRIGPLYIHHNRLIDGAPFGIWFSMDASPAEAYVYHNTIERSGHEALFVAREAMKRDSLAPRWHFVNNLIVSERGFTDPPKGKSFDFTATHNVIVKDETSRAAIDAGLDLSTYRNGKPLPGCEPGYFKGKAPDAGADEAGAR